jgi:homoserine dehydrogenase
MTAPLKIGIAGLGTVGVSVMRVLRDHAAVLERQCGRKIEVRAVSARNRAIDRGIDLIGVDWFDDPVDLATRSDIDVFVELMGGERAAIHRRVLR